MTIDEAIKTIIKEYLTERFYIEGEKEDYFFGKSQLNEALTIFFNNITMKTVMESAISASIKRLTKEAGLNQWDVQVLDLNDSAFNIPVRIYTYELFQDDKDNRFNYVINCMETGVLEKAIKEQPKRWKLYLNSHQKKSRGTKC